MDVFSFLFKRHTTAYFWRWCCLFTTFYTYQLMKNLFLKYILIRIKCRSHAKNRLNSFLLDWRQNMSMIKWQNIKPYGFIRIKLSLYHILPLKPWRRKHVCVCPCRALIGCTQMISKTPFASESVTKRKLDVFLQSKSFRELRFWSTSYSAYTI